MFALLAYLFVCSLLIVTFHLLLFLSSRISFILRRKGQIGKVEVTSIPPQMSLQVSLYLSLIVLTVIIMMITVRGFSHRDHCTDSLITVHPHCNHCTDSVITVHPHCDHCTDSLITVTATPFMIIVITTLLRLPWSLPLSQWYGILPHDTYVINASGKHGWLSPLLPRMQFSSQRRAP